MNEIDTDLSTRLQAYHDGELRGLARWRLERRLRREPRLRRELDALARLGGLVRACEARAGEPELWDRIALRLPAADARRAEGAEAERPASRWRLGSLGAAAAAAVVLAIYLGWDAAPSPSGGVVQWMDSGGRPVVLLEDDGETEVTIIWVLEGAVEGAARGGRRDVV